MPEENQPTRDEGQTEAQAGNVTYLDQALWRRLAQATSASELCQSWLDVLSRLIGGVTGALVVLESDTDAAFVPTAALPRGDGDIARLKGVVDRALKENQGVVTRSPSGEESPDGRRYHLAFPVRVGKKVHGVAAIEITPRPQDQLQSAMRQLQWGVPWIQSWIQRQGIRPGTHDSRRATTALELTALALDEREFRASATAFATEMATRLNCDRVSVGFVQGSQLKVLALSHSSKFGKRMNLFRAISMAMGEAVDQRTVLVYPEGRKESGDVLYLHKQLARAHGDDAICTVPFGDDRGKPVGALMLERSSADRFDTETVELCDGVAAIVGPILEAKRQNDRLLITKIGLSIRDQARKLFGPRHTARKITAAIVLSLALFFTFATGEYRVTGKTLLEGEVRRVVVAPYRGFIFEAPIRAGDVVTEGQVLCTLDERDLRLEYSRWSSERQQYVVEHRKAMAERDTAAMGILTKKIAQADAELALLSEQLQRARIVAPFDGLVVSGDLSQSLGAPIESGDVLFEVTPLESYRVMLQVDEREIGQVRVGQSGHLVLTAMPEAKLGFSVRKITPVSVSEEGNNFFVVEAFLDEATLRLRPGMEGFGKIRVDRRKLIWIWTHKLFDWIKLKAWTWLP